MQRLFLGTALGIALFVSVPTARADEIKRALYVLGIHMGGAEGVAVQFIGEPTATKPGAMMLMRRNLNWSIDVASTLKLPTEGLKSLLADVEADKVTFAEMAKRLEKIRFETVEAAGKSINPGAGAFFIMGVHLSGGEGLALGAQDFARDDKPGTGGLIERQLARLADGTKTIGVTLKPVIDLQEKLGKGASFREMAGDFKKLREDWDKELGAQPGFGVVAGGGGGKVLFSNKGNLTKNDPRDTRSKDKFAKVFVVQLKKDQTIIIDLESGDGNPMTKPGFFDTWLRLEDPNGKELAYNDDVVSGKNYNSRIEYLVPADGNYRIVVTTFRSDATGEFSLTVRQK